MTNFFSTLYCIVIEKSISNKAICKFKTKLVLFNSYYRVAKRLLIIVQNNKFIDKNNNNASNNDKTKDKNKKNKNKNKNKII
jgi:hypothetical protein